tara:strand:- start:355 stop:1143 length:789 start_codon:yes stop_codon:yes gene_type:complete
MSGLTNSGAVFNWRIEVGAATGAVEIKFLPYMSNMVAKRLTWTYDGVSSDEYSFDGIGQTTGWKKGFYGLSSATQTSCVAGGITNANGSNGASVIVPDYNYDYSTGGVSTVGNVVIGAISSAEVMLNAGGPANFQEVGHMVVPKPNASPSYIDLKLEIPCDDPSVVQDQIFQSQVCPHALREFECGLVACGQYTTSIFCSRVNNTVDGEMSVLEGDWVFWDPNAVNKVPDGTYYVKSQNPAFTTPDYSINVVNSVVASVISC